MELNTLIKKIESVDAYAREFLKKFEIKQENGKFLFIAPGEDYREWLETIVNTFLEDELRNSIEIRDKEERRKKAEIKDFLNPRYTLENFIVGEGNRLAYEVVKEALENLGSLYNPIFIYGSVGTGKTHLLQAAGNEAKKRGYRVIYSSADDFAHAMVEHLKKGTINEFRNMYKSVDLLLLDDVQFLSGKERTQIEFFHIFNTLYLLEKQIILASDRHPQKLDGVSDRLVSRFEGGILVEIELDNKTKFKIIKEKLREFNLELKKEIIDYLLENSKNVREIEGKIKLIKLKGFEGLEEKKEKNKLEKIIEFVANYYAVKVDDILSDKRNKRTSEARKIAMYLCRKVCSASLIEIARVFKRKDHTTVIHAIRSVEEKKRKDRKFKHLVGFLEKQAFDKIC